MMNKDTIIIEPVGGLCNRMRMIVSAWHAAEGTGKRLFMLWRNDAGCNCSYSKLFNLPESLHSYIANSSPAKKLINQIPKLFRKSAFFTDDDLLHWKSEGKSFEMLSRPGSIYIRSCETLYSYEDQHFPPFDYSIFRTKQDILSALPGIFTETDRPGLIGIHIRRTDNTLSIQNSPLELFMKNMDREMDENHNNCVFFIASDDSEIKSLLLNRYGSEHIFTRTGIELSRAAQNGIRDAYIDLLCLSKCSKIYGSYWSSFSECAAEIGNIPLFICKQ